MTAWHDQKPLSRRQARQNERGDAAETVIGLATPEQHPIAPADGADAAVASGRRAQQAYPQAVPQPGYAAPTSEPLTYSTQGRPQAPTYDGTPFRGSSDPAASPADAPRPDDQPPAYRVRDFSPEARQSAPITPAPAWAPPATDPSGLLDYHTQAAPAPQAIPTPVVTPAAGERTMSRRELRAMQQRAEEQRLAAVPPIAPAPQAFAAPQLPQQAPQPIDGQWAFDQRAAPEPVPRSPEPQRFRERSRQQQSTPFNDALAEFDALTSGARVPEPSQPVVFPPLAESPAAQASVAQAPVGPPPLVEPRASAPAPTGFDELLGDLLTPSEPTPVQPEPARAWEAVPQTPADPAPWQAAQEQSPIPRPEGARFTPPVGHWSTQAKIDDDEQFPETTLTRNIATTGSATTSALVLPEMPRVDDILSPLGSTGEVLVTGTINLPRSLSTSGAHPGRLDHSDMDALLDSAAREDSSDPDSAPIRAIRAISTQTGPNVIINAKKHKRRNVLPTVLAVCAAVMVAGVVVLVVVGFVFKSF